MTKTVTLEQILQLNTTGMLTRAVLTDHLATATPAQRTFIYDLLKAECDSRRRSKIATLTKQATFPAIKTFDAFDWSHAQLPVSLQQQDLREVSFITARENIVMTGPVGTGKTHLATAIGIAACQARKRVKFATVASLVLALSKAAQLGNLDRELTMLTKYDLLILDEFGYVPIDLDQARMLYQVIAAAYETRSLIITTNLEFSRWGEILADTQMAAALLERVIHHGHHIRFQGTSWRLENSLMKTSTITK